MEYSIGERLRIIRGRRDLTLAKLCQATGIAPATLSRFETNQQEPRFGEVERIGKALGFRVEIVEEVE